jgi:hypothetical protein
VTVTRLKNAKKANVLETQHENGFTRMMKNVTFFVVDEKKC